MTARWPGALLLCVAAAAAQPEVDPAFARHGIVALDYRSPQFRTSLSQLIGDENVRVCEPVLRDTLILWNTNPSPVSILVLRYPRPKEAPGQTLVIVRLAAASLSLGRGEALVVPPDTGLTQALHFARTGKQAPITPQRAMAWLQQGVVLGTVSLDSVVFADGGVIGPDRFDVAAMERGRVAAEDEIIRRAQDAALSDGDFRRWLEEVGGNPSDIDLTRATGEVNMYRRGLAKAMVSRLRAPGMGGRASVAPTLEGVQRRRVPSPSQLHRLD